MTSTAATTKGENIFLRMHPAVRLLLGVLVASVAWIFISELHVSTLFRIITLWDVFSFTLVLTSWVVLLTRSPGRIRELASKEDGSLVYVFLIILGSSLASMIAVLLLIISKESTRASELLYLAIAISGMLLSWITVHTTFTFHYAHMFYDDDDNNPGKIAAGLDFPNDEKPDYLDFAYFSFVIGMTFQVSDVEISSKRIRRVALIHGMISFVLNTFVVALTINLIAGLKH